MRNVDITDTDVPLAYDILSASKKAGLGRSKLFEEINAGRLKARKAGRRTLILHEDLAAWLASLPQRGQVAA
jgi:hypothetical protein